MKMTTLALLLLCATTAWGQVDTIVPIHPPDLMAQGKTADMAAPKVFPLAGDDLVPQMANGELGGGQIFFMEWRIQNITNAEATVDIDYFDSDGDRLEVPSREPDGTIQSFIGISAVVPANGIRYGGTWPFDAPVKLGYARVVSNPPGAVVVTGLYNNQVPGVPLFQAAIPMTTRNHKRFFVPFGNIAGQRSSLAIVSLTAQTVTVNARDSNGVIQCMFDRPMGAGSHYAFVTQLDLTCTENSEGVIEVIAPDPTIGGVGFSALPADGNPGTGAFTTLQVFGPTL